VLSQRYNIFQGKRGIELLEIRKMLLNVFENPAAYII